MSEIQGNNYSTKSLQFLITPSSLSKFTVLWFLILKASQGTVFMLCSIGRKRKKKNFIQDTISNLEMFFSEHFVLLTEQILVFSQMSKYIYLWALFKAKNIDFAQGDGYKGRCLQYSSIEEANWTLAIQFSQKNFSSPLKLWSQIILWNTFFLKRKWIK